MTIGALFAAIPLIGVAAGLARAKYRRAPFIFAALVAAAYGLSTTAFGIWAANCWDCTSEGSTRGDVFTVFAFLFGIMAATTLIGVWLGARLMTMLQRLRVTWRELREVTSNGDSDADRT